MNIRKWIIDLANAWDHRMKNERQLDMYEDEIRKLELNEIEMESLRLQLTREFDKFPSISQLVQIGRSATRTKSNVEPDWRTWQDDHGRTVAQKFPGHYRATMPSDRDMARWKEEACSPEEGRELFKKAFAETLAKKGKTPEDIAVAMAPYQGKGMEPVGSVIGRVLPELDKPVLESRRREPEPEPEIDLLDDLEVEP